MTFEELAKRCEDAVRPDRKLDVAIATLVSGLSNEHFAEAIDQIGIEGSGWTPSEDEWPRYTESIDAALTLASSLRGLSLNRRSNPDMGGRDWLVSAGSNRSAARSWALALCAVGLRDRAKWTSSH